MRVQSPVPAPYHQARLIDYLAGRFTYYSAEKWYEFIADGRVSVDGDKVTSAAIIVRQNAIVACELPEIEPVSADFNYRIVYEDDWLLGIDKPRNLRVHARGRYVQANLIYHLRFEHDPPYPEATLINRLDAYTSGVILAARDTDTLRFIQAQFQAGSVRKEYVAVVHGVPTPLQGAIELPIGAVPDARPPRFWVDAVVKLRPSLTHYRVLDQSADATRSLVQLKPHTGRTHQIRVHLAAIGHPIVGDWLYANGSAPPTTDSNKSAHLLHASLTEFLHPQTQKRCIIKASLPEDIVNGLGG